MPIGFIVPAGAENTMAAKRSFFERNGQRALSIAVLMSERHSRAATVTDHPIETGSSVQDHRVLGPEEVDIDGALSDIPATLDDRTAEQILRSGETSDQTLQQMLAAAGPSGGLTTVQEQYAALDAIWVAKETVDLITGQRAYRNMMPVRYTTQRDKTTGQIVQFQLGLKQIVFADSQTVAVPAQPAAIAKPQTKAGPKATKKAPAKVEEKGGSMLDSMFGDDVDRSLNESRAPRYPTPPLLQSVP